MKKYLRKKHKNNFYTNLKKLKIEKHKLLQNVRNFNENNKIKKISKNSFIINIKHLDNSLNLNPIMYNFKMSYEYIIQKLYKTNLEDTMNVIKSIIDDGFINDNNRIIKFHPEVIEHLKTLV